MVLSVIPKISTNKDCIKIGDFLYSKTEDSIFLELPYPFKVQLKITELWRVEVTPGFLKLPSILRGGINFDLLCRELELINYIQSDKLLLHASCVGNNSGTLIVGFPQSGKTYNTFKSVMEGFPLVSEEYTLIYKDLAFPYKLKCRSCLSRRTIKDCGFPLTLKESVSLSLNTIRAKILPFLFEAVIWKDFPVSGKTARVDCIVYGSSNKLIKDPKQLILLTENEFPFMSESILEAYSFVSGFDLISIQDKQRKLITEFVNVVNHTTK